MSNQADSIEPQRPVFFRSERIAALAASQHADTAPQLAAVGLNASIRTLLDCMRLPASV